MAAGRWIEESSVPAGRRWTIDRRRGQVPIQRWAFERDAFERVKNDRHSSVQNS